MSGRSVFVQTRDLPLDADEEVAQALAAAKMGERHEGQGMDVEGRGELGHLLQGRALQAPFESAHVGAPGDVREVFLREATVPARPIERAPESSDEGQALRPHPRLSVQGRGDPAGSPAPWRGSP